ncbi:MAG: OmpA family protein [Bacteroidota bacterium]
MKFRTTLLFFLLVTSLMEGQNKKSKGDFLFFEYAYAEAITEYNKELGKGPLTNQQYLNLADAYLKTGNYKSASDNYLKVFKKDSTMSHHYFNKMLQSLSKTSGTDRAKAFLATRSAKLSEELMENASFNFELLNSGDDTDLDFRIFNIDGNSPQSDFSPAFFKDRFLFTSARPQKAKKIYGPSGESYLDIYVARINPDGNILNANPFTEIPSSKYHKATPYFSEELNSLFYILSNTDGGELTFDENGKNTLAMGFAKRQGPLQYLLRDLSTSFYYPFYDGASGRLYFAANFEDSIGGTDIYYVHTNRGMIMSAPVNLGPRINTPGNEIAPFIFENSLYFSSDVFYGLGGMDMYKSNIQSGESFSIPVNLGEGINSDKDDFGFIMKNDDKGGLIGYFSSNRLGGKGNDDIYGFKVKEKPGLKTLAIKGMVLKHDSKLGVSKTAIKVLDLDNTLIKEIYTKEDGSYQIEIPWRAGINLEVSKERYSSFYGSYEGPTLENLQKTPLDIHLALLDDLVQERENQTVIKMNKFFFEKNRASVTPEIALELDKVVYAVQKFPKLQLRVESHTDSRGGSSTNFRLSQNRSDAIMKYLVKSGVPSSNILYTIGYGEDKLTNKCKNGVYCIEYLHKQNERSLIAVLNYDLLY